MNLILIVLILSNLLILMASSNPDTFLAETWNFLRGYEFFLPKESKLFNYQIFEL